MEFESITGSPPQTASKADRFFLCVAVVATCLWVVCVSNRTSELTPLPALFLPFVSLGLGGTGIVLGIQAWRAQRPTSYVILATIVALVPAFFLFVVVSMFMGPPAGEDW
jgi:hypothetical protein